MELMVALPRKDNCGLLQNGYGTPVSVIGHGHFSKNEIETRGEFVTIQDASGKTVQTRNDRLFALRRCQDFVRAGQARGTLHLHHAMPSNPFSPPFVTSALPL
jgi:hypothetical protein